MKRTTLPEQSKGQTHGMLADEGGAIVTEGAPGVLERLFDRLTAGDWTGYPMSMNYPVVFASGHRLE